MLPAWDPLTPAPQNPHRRVGSPVLSPAPQVPEKPTSSSRKPRILPTRYSFLRHCPALSPVRLLAGVRRSWLPQPQAARSLTTRGKFPAGQPARVARCLRGCGLLWGQGAGPARLPRSVGPCRGDSCGQIHPEALPRHCPLCVCPAPSWPTSSSSALTSLVLELRGRGSRISVPNSCFGMARREPLSSGSTGTHLPPPHTQLPGLRGVKGSSFLVLRPFGHWESKASGSQHPYPARVSLRPGP